MAANVHREGRAAVARIPLERAVRFRRPKTCIVQETSHLDDTALCQVLGSKRGLCRRLLAYRLAAPLPLDQDPRNRMQFERPHPVHEPGR